MKYVIESLRRLRQEKDDIESEGEIAEVNRLNEDLKRERKELKTYMEGMKDKKVSRPRIVEEVSEEVTVKSIKMDEMLEAGKKI